MESVFNTLSEINVNEHTEKKDGLTYLSWCWAWSEVKKRYPDASYKIYRNNDGLPYFFDEGVGYMCMTDVTINGETLMMWLPVMDGKNKAMKETPYTYKTKYGDKSVESATMFDINKTLMRCLVKNLAMFGLGSYIYAGEDLPESESKDEKKDFSLDEYVTAIKRMKVNIDKDDPEWWDGIKSMFDIKKWGDINESNYNEIGRLCREKVFKINEQKGAKSE